MTLRRFSVSNDNVTLYQFQTCPFCNRVKAYLDYNKLKYSVVEVNPLTKKEVKFSGSKSVPIATVGDKIIRDSANIIDHLRMSNPNDTLSFSPEDDEKWMTWSEKKLSVLLYPNITRTFGESWQAFAYVGGVQSWSWIQRLSNRVLGPVAMFLVNGKIKKKYGIIDERAELLTLLKEWTDAVGPNRYLHGDTVTLPDLMVFGVLRGINTMPTFDFIMSENQQLKKWYDNVSAVM